MTTFALAPERRIIRTMHGMSGTPVHAAWKRMIERCYSPSSPVYKYYGGRGILVAHRWMTFEHFWFDMASGHLPGLSLDRIDPDGHYTPDNCRWASAQLQSINKRNVRFINVAGRRTALAAAARAYGLHPETVARRLGKGEPMDSALSRHASCSPAARPVLVDGRLFPSLSEAARAVGVTRSAIFGRLKRGTASYAHA